MKMEFSGFDQFKEVLSSLKMTKKKLFILMSVATALILGVSFYFGLVPINFHHGGFRALIVVLLLIWSLPLVFYKAIYGMAKKRRQSFSQGRANTPTAACTATACRKIRLRLLTLLARAATA